MIDFAAPAVVGEDAASYELERRFVVAQVGSSYPPARNPLCRRLCAGNWDGFLAAIEQAVPQVEALGITDYCTIRSYKQFLAYRKEGRASNVRLVFPNVEFRLDI